VYAAGARNGSVMYFCVAGLATVDPMYQYSLEWFRALFQTALEQGGAPPTSTRFVTIYIWDSHFRPLPSPPLTILTHPTCAF
jgi:hypothetical protein